MQEVGPRTSEARGRGLILRRLRPGGRAAVETLRGESRRLCRMQPRTAAETEGLGEGHRVRLGGLWGLLPNCTWPRQPRAPSGLCPERGLRGGPPGRMFSTARYVWSGPRAACRHGNKTGAVAAPELRPGWGLSGGKGVRLAGCWLPRSSPGSSRSSPPVYPGQGLPAVPGVHQSSSPQSSGDVSPCLHFDLTDQFRLHRLVPVGRFQTSIFPKNERKWRNGHMS